MSTVRICQSCGTAMPSDAPEGLCPKCLIAPDSATIPATKIANQKSPIANPRVWKGATLALKAFREQRFVFFLSREEEQTAQTTALLEERLEVEEKAREVPPGIFFAAVMSAMFLVFPYLYWGPDEEESWNASFVVGEAGAFTLALTAILRNFGRSTCWDKFSPVLLIFSALAVMLTIYLGPITLALRGLGFGAVIGTALGLVVRFTRKTKGAS